MQSVSLAASNFALDSVIQDGTRDDAGNDSRRPT